MKSFSDNSNNEKYFNQRIKNSEDILKILNSQNLFEKEIRDIQKTLAKVEEEIAENNIGDYWLLGSFSALDINLAVTVYHLRLEYKLKINFDILALTETNSLITTDYFLYLETLDTMSCLEISLTFSYSWTL